jgi:acyl-CoA thioesterase-1
VIDMMKRQAALVLLAFLIGCDGADTRDAPGRIEDGASADSARAGEARGRASRLPGQRSPADARGVVLFLGTSLTAGYGLGEEYAYPAVIQSKIDSAGLPFRVVNAGLSGETSAGGLSRLDWTLQQPIEVLVLELGANDGLRGLPVAQMRANLDSIITRTRARFPDAGIVIAGMQAPPNLGGGYTQAFTAAYRDLAARHDAALVPFLLEGVGGLRGMNQADGIHPTIEGQRVLAANVWSRLVPVLESRAHR